LQLQIAGEQENASSLLAAVLKQLIQSRPWIAESVEKLRQQHTKLLTRPSMDDILNCTQSVLSKLSTVYVVVDALDECRDADGTRRNFLNILRSFQQRSNLHLMITSRFIPDIVEDMEGAVTLEIRASDEDIRRFVAGQLHRLPACIRRDSDLQSLVQEGIVEATDGM
jgi:hypothetical protein